MDSCRKRGNHRLKDPDTYQVKGNHYKTLDPQPWDVAIAWDMSFLEGNILKYLARYRSSRESSIDDLRKLQHYTEKLIETEMDKQRQ
jgi:hypothetical protein